MSIGKRTKAAREDLGLSQENVVDAIKELGYSVDQSALSLLEKDEIKRPRYLKELAVALKVTEDWLLYGENFGMSEDVSYAAPATLPIIGVVAAGIWAERKEPIIEKRIPIDPMFPLDAQFGLEVGGDSLKGKNCVKGDILHCISTEIIYPNQGDVVIAESQNGDLYEFTAKIIHRNPDGSLELHAANDKYPPIKMSETTEDTEIRVIGKVVRVFREMK